jgi:hypothetical protein
LYGIEPINAEKLGMPELQSKQHDKAPPFVVLLYVLKPYITMQEPQHGCHTQEIEKTNGKSEKLPY